MGDLQTKASGGNPSIIKGQLKTTFRRVKGCKRLDRMIAHRNMEKMGYTQVNKKKVDGSFFSNNWESFVF